MAKTKGQLTDIEMFCLDAYIVNDNVDMAYLHSRRSKPKATEDSIHRSALRWIAAEHVQEYLKERRGSFFISDTTGETVGRYREKDAILSELEKQLPLASGKEKTDILLKLAELQQMKKEETKTEEERVHFYMPLPICPGCNRKQEILESLDRENNQRRLQREREWRKDNRNQDSNKF